MNKQVELIKKSGLSVAKVAELTGINYKKLYRVIQDGAELKFSEIQKIEKLNKYIDIIKAECEAI